MTWDPTVPLDTEAVNNGANRIRELKSQVNSMLTAEGAVDATNLIFAYRGIKDTTVNRPAFGSHGLFFDSTRSQMQRDSGAAWEDVGTMIPAGTVMVFYQASVPTGWTAVSANDKFLRVVSGGGTGGSTGGTVAASTSLAHSHTVSAHTHTISSDGGHTHTVNSHIHQLDFTFTNGSGVTGSVLSVDGVGNVLGTAPSGGGLNGLRVHKNITDGSAPATDSQGAHTHGAATGSASPGTDTQFGGAFAYADVVFGTKS